MRLLPWAWRAQAPTRTGPKCIWTTAGHACSEPRSGKPATCSLRGATDSSGLGKDTGLPPWSTELWESWGSGRFVPLMVMHGPANSLHEAVNSGAAAAAALQALCNAGLWSLLQINTICSAEHVSFLHDTHSLLPRWQHGERQRGPGKGGKMWPRPFLTPTHSFNSIACVGEGH